MPRCTSSVASRSSVMTIHLARRSTETNARTRRALHEIDRDRRADVGPALDDGGKAAADEMRAQAADDGFDFGKLGHDDRDPAPCALPFSSGACYGAPRNDASD